MLNSNIHTIRFIKLHGRFPGFDLNNIQITFYDFSVKGKFKLFKLCKLLSVYGMVYILYDVKVYVI